MVFCSNDFIIDKVIFYPFVTLKVILVRDFLIGRF